MINDYPIYPFCLLFKLNNENALRNPHEFDNVAPAKDSNFLM